MKVVFRKFKSDGEIIALFPQTLYSRYVTSYMHIGQHGDADYHWCIRISKPATPEEYKPLLNELKSIGYDNLRIVKKSKLSCEEA